MKGTIANICHSSRGDILIIKGFNQEQIERIIDHHFKDRQGMGDRMKRELFSGLQVYKELVTCPLLCQLFCLLFDKDEKFPVRVTDVYWRLIVYLVRFVFTALHCYITRDYPISFRRERMIYGQPPLTEDVLPPQHEKALQTSRRDILAADCTAQRI